MLSSTIIACTNISAQTTVTDQKHRIQLIEAGRYNPIFLIKVQLKLSPSIN